jgi:hypothetical protein
MRLFDYRRTEALRFIDSPAIYRYRCRRKRVLDFAPVLASVSVTMVEFSLQILRRQLSCLL